MVFTQLHAALPTVLFGQDDLRSVFDGALQTKEGIVELPCAAPEEDQSLTNVSDFPTILIVFVLLERGVERCEK